MIERAQTHHQSGSYVSRYPHFEFCQRREKGSGFEAKFNKVPGSRVGVTYYFDEQGHFITERVLICIF